MIQTVFDQSRGCGDRKPGGLYFVGGGMASTCDRFPIALETCPCCGRSMLGDTGKPSRGFAWIDIRPFILRQYGTNEGCGAKICGQCPVGRAAGVHGLIWIGEKYYPTPSDFIRESFKKKLNDDIYGISRRISGGHLPKGFVVGKTWILLAHRKAIPPSISMGQSEAEIGDPGPGIFGAFKPERVEYVVKGTETEEEIAAMEKRGITPVRVEKLGEQFTLPKIEEDDEE